MRNKQYEELFDISFSKREIICCFWCCKNVTRVSATIEHLVSKGFARRNGYHYDSNENLRISCKDCNFTRGQITQLYLVSLRIRKKLPIRNDWSNRKQLILPSINKFIKLIEGKIKEKHLKCLMLKEISSVLNTDFNKVKGNYG